MGKGAEEIPGLTDDNKPRRLGPKRASNIRKLFGLSKEDDVRKFVVRRDTGKRKKAAKIQRLVTPLTLQRKRALRSKMVAKIQTSRAEKAEFDEKCIQWRREKRELKAAEVAKKKAAAAKEA